MPVKNGTKRPQSVIDEAVKRYLAGESVAVLAKYYKISKPGLYLWIARYKRDILEQSRKSGMQPHDVETSDKRTLIAEIQQLKLENHKLRDRVVSLMIKAGEL